MLTWLTGRRKSGHQVLMYTREGCHLCAEAWQVLEESRARHGFSLEKIDVDTNPELVREHGQCVPVVLVDGRVRFRGRVNKVLLERLLRATTED